MNTSLLSTLFLANGALIGVSVGLSVGILIALGVGIFCGIFFSKKSTEKRLGEVSERTRKMIEDASLE